MRMPITLAARPRCFGAFRSMPYSSRAAYDGVAEFSIYVAGAHQGRGAGRLVLQELLAEAERAGIHKVTSRVFSHNAASRAL